MIFRITLTALSEQQFLVKNAHHRCHCRRHVSVYMLASIMLNHLQNRVCGRLNDASNPAGLSAGAATTTHARCHRWDASPRRRLPNMSPLSSMAHDSGDVLSSKLQQANSAKEIRFFVTQQSSISFSVSFQPSNYLFEVRTSLSALQALARVHLCFSRMDVNLSVETRAKERVSLRIKTNNQNTQHTTVCMCKVGS